MKPHRTTKGMGMPNEKTHGKGKGIDTSHEDDYIYGHHHGHHGSSRSNTSNGRDVHDNSKGTSSYQGSARYSSKGSGYSSKGSTYGSKGSSYKGSYEYMYGYSPRKGRVGFGLTWSSAMFCITFRLMEPFFPSFFFQGGYSSNGKEGFPSDYYYGKGKVSFYAFRDARDFAISFLQHTHSPTCFSPDPPLSLPKGGYSSKGGSPSYESSKVGLSWDATAPLCTWKCNDEYECAVVLTSVYSSLYTVSLFFSQGSTSKGSSGSYDDDYAGGKGSGSRMMKSGKGSYYLYHGEEGYYQHSHEGYVHTHGSYLRWWFSLKSKIWYLRWSHFRRRVE
jgi:hypothetical protein